MAGFRKISPGAVSTFACRHCRRSSGRAWCFACSIAQPSTSISRCSECPTTSTSTSSKSSSGRTEYSFPPGEVTRLVDMGVETILISSTLEAVLGQRLLRSICPNCRSTYEPNDVVLAQLEIARRDIGDKKFYFGKGCEVCNQTGYKGRKGI